jgi:2,3-bisphosphoglycerate-independent phosphoglycerate mutase
VPITIVGANVRRDNVMVFDEISAANGCLGLLRNKELMFMALNYSDRSMLQGHQIGDIQRAYFPDFYEPFKIDI